MEVCVFSSLEKRITEFLKVVNDKCTLKVTKRKLEIQKESKRRDRENFWIHLDPNNMS
ncbi:hypothetical protein KSP40_PGU011710 [Platanthera guangdongensis]|uniref:Uncharacterized protein n=1 Tax=Platanthera guangdongensis TaxID=2320717 RepID=A0ABR2MKS6_9ASPA